MPVPPRGEFRFFSSVQPALDAGRYQLTMNQTIDKAPGTIAPVRRHFVVTGPRFSLAPNEVLSVFPPPNAIGAFSTRLAQVVLRRRTLPWERDPRTAPGGPRPPWLALVVLADGEAQFLSGVAVADAMPADVRSRLGVTETGTCDALLVSRRVVDQVFPREDELELLCHVRQVNREDTEMASKDDDGFMAVVISHRLPRPGQSYVAYLISLEGQLSALPDPAPSQDDVGPSLVYDIEPTAVRRAVADRGTYVLGATAAPPQEEVETSPPGAVAGRWHARPVRGGTISASEETSSVPIASTGAAFVNHRADFTVLEAAVGETFDPGSDLLRFPVLAHWAFTCEPAEEGQGGDFQSLMTRLHVGLLGTTPPVAGERPPPRVAVTGHAVLGHVTRRGEEADAWYRGPLSPRQVRRTASPAPYHAADQARRIADDGMEDMSEAAAFEAGRLLALSDRQFLALLAEWRRSGFVLSHLAAAAADLGLETEVVEDARGFWIDRLAALAEERYQRVAPPIEIGKATRLVREDDMEIIADGLGLSRDLVAEVLSPRVTGMALEVPADERPEPSGFDELRANPEPLEPLHSSLRSLVERVVEEAEAPGRRPDDLEPGNPPWLPGEGDERRRPR
jgi:hypothetical protein